MINILDINGFKIDATGDGRGYYFRNKRSKRDVHIEGDDAAEFRAIWEALERDNPQWGINRVMWTLWGQFASR